MPSLIYLLSIVVKLNRFVSGEVCETDEEEKKLSACRGGGSAIGPLLAARALPLPGVRARCQD
jgi:hypothetical protein